MMGNYGTDVFTITEVFDIRRQIIPNKETNNAEI